MTARAWANLDAVVDAQGRVWQRIDGRWHRPFGRASLHDQDMDMALTLGHVTPVAAAGQPTRAAS